MDETPHCSGKKQRQRNQRDRRKNQEKQSELASPTVSNVSDPQPQRTNRRQRNEAVTTSSNNVDSSIPPNNTDVKVTTEKENVTIDFSNLKRETEEITKLTKKFAKRNISSNWHRYSAPEGAEDDEKTEEEAPADFSALIQVPASKGGHLQLKDEQEWSSASNEQLGGYFALNLKLLNQSLACIPLYKQLRLPKHMFTEEELKHFDNLASEARKLYNPDKVEYTNELVEKAINLSQMEIDATEDTETKKNINTCKEVNILNVCGNNQKLLNTDLKPEIISKNSPGDISNLPDYYKNSVEKDKSIFSILSKEDGNSVQPNKKSVDSNRSLEGIGENLSLLSSLMENEVSESKKNETSPSDKISKGIYQTDETKILTEAAKEISINTSKEIPQTNKNSPESIIIKDPKDKHDKSNRKTPVRDVGENKLNNTENTLKLEDDDDLDFLLSLKKPILPENKKLNHVPDKDSTIPPGSRKSPQASSAQQHSELDDWLDSVLQD